MKGVDQCVGGHGCCCHGNGVLCGKDEDVNLARSLSEG